MRALQEQEIQQELVALEEEAEAAEMLGILQVLMAEEIVVVMVRQEAMAEAEGVAAARLAAIAVVLMVAAALAALD